VKVKLTSGAELDVLTQEEVRELLQEFASGYLRPPQTARPVGGIPLNASGNSCRSVAAQAGTAAALPVDLYSVPIGYSFRLHRMTFKPDGFTFGVPFTNATGFIDINRGELMQDGISLNSPGMPVVWSAGTADGIFYDNGEHVFATISGGPASVNVSVRMQGTLQPIVRQ
jgi:hypothetical protein